MKKIKQRIIDAINNPTSRNRIGLKLGCGEQVIALHIRQNKTNGRLTKLDALEAISEETGIVVQDLYENAREKAAK
jgi:hypothetical protein